MKQVPSDELRNVRFRHLALLVTFLSLAILAGTIYLVSRQLRERIREEIASRDGEIMHGVALMEDPSDQLALVLRTSQLKSVMAVRLFDADGRFVQAFPDDSVRPATLVESEIRQVKQLRPVSRYLASVRLEEIFKPEETNVPSNKAFPLLAVTIPIHKPDQSRLLCMAQFILDGTSIAGQFAALDRNLVHGALTAFFISGAGLLLALAWAFRRLQRAHQQLAKQTASLIRANHELALAAKTSAVGTITSHLIHGLKNPLAGLHGFVSSPDRIGKPAQQTDPEWLEAAATTRRMQSLINQIVLVLSEEKGAGSYEISLIELVEIVSAKMQLLAREHGVAFSPTLKAKGTLASRDANLAILILENLLQNAIQATPQNGAVKLTISANRDHWICEVEDQGPGLPQERREAVFTPGHSTKTGGSGLGLAISKQLAKQIGAELELKNSSGSGCVFVLSLLQKSDLLTNELASPTK